MTGLNLVGLQKLRQQQNISKIFFRMQNQRKIDDAYVIEAVNNMEYIYKDQVKQYIISFLKKQISFRPFDAIRTVNNTIVSFIELRGFMQIGKNYSHEMVIGVPTNFPQLPPLFLLSVNRQLFKINRQQQMITNREILLEKDQRGAQYVRFNFNFISNQWKPMSSLIDAFSQLNTIINSPPILIEISNQKKHNQWQELHQSNRNNSSKNNIRKGSSQELIGLVQLADNKSIELSNTFSALKQLEDTKEKLNYQHSRNTYLTNYHLKELHTHLTYKSKQLISKTQEFKTIKQKSEEKSTCDDFLLTTQKDQQKLQRMAEKQALKEAEKKVKETLQKELENGKKYSDYKKIVRSLFSQMYENQSKILQAAQ